MAPSDASRETLHSHAEERKRAIALASSGAYENWHAVCRKMLFDGWDVEIFIDILSAGSTASALTTARANRIIVRPRTPPAQEKYSGRRAWIALRHRLGPSSATVVAPAIVRQRVLAP
jgi:hypothetical protein